MYHFASEIIVFIYFACFTLSVIIHPLGPTHRRYAVECIEQITDHAYSFIRSRSRYYSQFLLTYIITRKLDSPAFEIQEQVLKFLHRQNRWAVEILQYGREDFQSFSENCFHKKFDFRNATRVPQPPNCRRRHVMHLMTHLYIIVAQEIDMFYKKLDHIVNTSSFNHEALYVVYFSKESWKNSFDIAYMIIKAMYERSIRNMVVVIRDDLKHFPLYALKFDFDSESICYTKLRVVDSFNCTKGNLNTDGENIFKEHNTKNYSKCIVDVHALPYEPFVIGNGSGIEPDVLREIGNSLNISFRIHIFPKAVIELGGKNNDSTWSGFLGPIYSNWDLGIGNVPPELELIKDFSYSVAYLYAKLVWVVPVAPYIPRWRVLMIIFTVEMWGICLASIFGFAVAFYVFKTKKDFGIFKTYEKCVTIAYQILVASPVPIQPISNYVRVYFIAMAFFAIIINAVYTSSLIDYLQNRVREYQITSIVEAIQQGIPAGSSPKYKEMFEAATGKHAKMLLETYQTVNESFDTYRYWLDKVANEKNITTISIRFYVQYLLSKNIPMLTNHDGEPKIFIIPKPIRSQIVSIIMRKGNYFEDVINSVIQRLIMEAGLIVKFRQSYVQASVWHSQESKIEGDDDDDDNNNPPGVVALSPKHLEGAFAILAFGQAFGLLAFLFEIFYNNVKTFFEKKSQ